MDASISFKTLMLPCSCFRRLQRQPGIYAREAPLSAPDLHAHLDPLSQGRVWLLDLNPFGEVTDSLLFSWEELASGDLTQQQVGERTCTCCLSVDTSADACWCF